MHPDVRRLEAVGEERVAQPFVELAETDVAVARLDVVVREGMALAAACQKR